MNRTIICRNYGKNFLLTPWSVCAIAALVFALASCNQKATTDSTGVYPNDLVSDNTKGPVTAIETISYLLDSAGKPGAIVEKYLVKYDSAGFVTTVTTTNGKDSVKSIATYTHSANGSLLQQLITTVSYTH